MTIHEVGRTWPRERPPRVLCVDDEAVTLRLICRLLERAGLQPVAAASPEEALRVFPRALAIVTPLLAAGRPTERESIGA